MQNRVPLLAHTLLLVAAVLIPATAPVAQAADATGTSSAPDLWQLANKAAPIHRYSTLFTAQDVRGHLSTPEGLQKAIDWCKQTGVTHAYIENFRDGYQADRTALLNAKKRFLSEGFLVSGCVTTTRVGKPSTGWKDTISCYTDPATQTKLKNIFEYAASLFDEIMIDDFWFTDCACPDCDAARKARTTTVDGRQFAVKGDTWEDYRCELMVRISQDLVLGAAKSVNSKARLIIKYPQWYDRFHERGYEVIRETADFDKIWVGTETRDYTDARWGGTPQYEAYFIMRWLGEIGGSKCGGGWFDPYGTTPATYLEQARQTILGGAKESLLFCYGSLLRDTGPKNIEALRANLPDLLAMAKNVHNRKPIGIAAYKPANSHPEKEQRVFDFVGMMGLPLVPCHEFPGNAPAAFFSVHSLKDPDLATKLSRFIKAGKPVLITDGLAAALKGQVDLAGANVQVLPVNGEPKSLLELPKEKLDLIRAPLLKSLRSSFKAPNRVALYLFKDNWVIENFNDQPVNVELAGKPLSIPARDWLSSWK